MNDTHSYFVYKITATGRRVLLSEHLHEDDAWAFVGRKKNRIMTDDRGVLLRREEAHDRA